MSNYFDFIVLAPNSSGMALATRFLNFYSDMIVFHPDDKALTHDTIETFFKNNPGKVKGILLKNSRYSKQDEQKILYQYLSPDCSVLEISPEPLENIISQLNHDIYNWAMTFAELYWLSLPQLEFATYGNSGFLRRILGSPIMDVAYATGPLLREKFAKYMHVAMQDIHQANMNDILNKFRSLVGLPPVEIPYPDDSIFATKNSFYLYICAMYFKGQAIRPCPLNYLPYSDYNEDDICLTVEQDEVNLPLGNYNGKLAFCFFDKHKQPDAATKAEIRAALKRDRAPVISWCNAKTRLYDKGLKLYEMFAYSEEELRNQLLADAEALELAKQYFIAHVDYYARYEPQFLVQSLPAIKFLASIL